MKNQKNNNLDVGIRYQLSLSIGHSLDLYQNCKSFLEAFIGLDVVDFAAIWIENNSNYSLCYSTVNYSNQLLNITFDAFEKNDILIKNDSQLFMSIKHDLDIDSGVYHLIRLGDIGYLKVYSERENLFSKEERIVIQPIIDQLIHSLKNCLEYQSISSPVIDGNLKGESVEMYNLIAQNLTEGLVFTDGNGVIQFVNKKISELCGYSRKELLGEVAYKLLLSPEEWSSVEERLSLNDKRELKGRRERKAIRKDGTIWWAILRVSPLITKSGRYIGILVTVNDISERKKQAEEKEELLKALEKSENLYRLVVQNLSEGVIMTDEKDRITYINPQMVTLTGYSEAEMLGQQAYKLLLPEEDWKSSEDRLDDRAEGITENYIKRHIRKDKTIWWGSINASPLKDSDGNFIGTLAAVMDVTERKIAGDEREALLQELAEKNKDLDEFTYIVSHDLKAPLRGIKTLSDWIYEDYAEVLDDDGKNQLQLLQRRVLRMHSFIESMLEYSKLGQTKNAKETFNLDDSLEQIIDSFQPLDNCEIKVLTKLPIIHAEKIRIEQVFQNLISNGIKYNDKSNGLIEIFHESGENYFKFGVRDNGKGIDKKYFDKIFQIFQTLETRDTYESTGVGLTIVKKIVESHNGKISVNSAVDKGTIFTFTLKKYPV